MWSRKTQVHVPRVQPQSAALSTVIAERRSCGHGNHEVRFEQDAEDENGKQGKDAVVSRLWLKALGASPRAQSYSTFTKLPSVKFTKADDRRDKTGTSLRTGASVSEEK